MTDVSQLNRYANIDGRVTYTSIQETETDYVSGKSNEKGVYQQILGNNYSKVFNNAGNLILFDYEKIMDYANPEAVSSEDFEHFIEDISDKMIDQAIDDENNVWLTDLVNYVSPDIYQEIAALDTNDDKKVSPLEAEGIAEGEGTKIEEHLAAMFDLMIENNSLKQELSDSDLQKLNELYLKAADELSENAFSVFYENLFEIGMTVLLFDFSDDPEKPIIKLELE